MTRRGYILIFVLGVTTVVTALGLSYIASNGTVMQQASNRYAAVRAQYVAESGVTLAEHFLLHPPTTVAANSHYSGGSGIAIDSSFDTVDITVTQTTPSNHFLITATATVRNVSGTEDLAKQKITSEVIIPPVPKWNITQAVLAPGSIDVPGSVFVVGNLHANGLATAPAGGGYCNGIVSATITALWLGSGPPSAVLSAQPAITCPPVSPSLYQNYSIKGVAYAAYTGYVSSSMNSAEATALNATLSAASNNPGRIVFLPAGDFSIGGGIQFTGMLVVRGNLNVNGALTTLTAAADYPALLVTGDILCTNGGKGITVTGPVLCGGKITDNGKGLCGLLFKGPTLVAQGVARSGALSSISFHTEAGREQFWDLSRTVNLEPVTRLSWQEN